MNRDRLRKLIILAASLAEDDPLRLKVQQFLISADVDLKKMAQTLFEQQNELRSLINASATAPAALEGRLLNVPRSEANLRSRTTIKRYWGWIGAAAALVLLVMVICGWVAHLRSVRRTQIAQFLAALPQPRELTSAPGLPAKAISAVAPLHLPFKAVIPAYHGFNLVGYSIIHVGDRTGLVTYWRSRMKRPCTLVQLPAALARQLNIRKSLTLHVRNTTGAMAATVTIWADPIAHCAWAQILPGDVSFYQPDLTYGGHPI